MRIGNNPNKDLPQDINNYSHQIIIPVYIPCHESYFKDSLRILKLCLESLFNTIHANTFITIVNNGSDILTKEYLDELWDNSKINELIHTNNIGKLNSIIKGIVGNNIQLVTISDADVLFLENWQIETNRIFKNFSKAGVVGIVPQIKTFEYQCGNVIFDHFFDQRMKFIPVLNSHAMQKFYESIGWENDYNQDYLKFGLGLEYQNNINAFIGSGHFVATYRKDIFEEIIIYQPYKLGGTSEKYLDNVALEKDYWRLTTQQNYAFHLGNVFEDWMLEIKHVKKTNEVIDYKLIKFKKINKTLYFIKNKLFLKILFSKSIKGLFFRWKGLSKSKSIKYVKIKP